MPLRILLADDHSVVREGLQSLLESRGFVVAGVASNGQEAAYVCEKLQPDVAVLDFSMPVMNGVAATPEIRRVSPKTRVIILSVHSKDEYILAALRAGAKGYVVKTSAADELVAAIREVSIGNVYLSPGISQAVVGAYLSRTELPADPLSSRERQVLQLIAEGKTNKEVAAQLGISPKTVESHRARIMVKIGIHNTADLVRYAIRRGLTQS